MRRANIEPTSKFPNSINQRYHRHEARGCGEYQPEELALRNIFLGLGISYFVLSRSFALRLKIVISLKGVISFIRGLVLSATTFGIVNSL
jgi:hypothetical protein